MDFSPMSAGALLTFIDLDRARTRRAAAPGTSGC